MHNLREIAHTEYQLMFALFSTGMKTIYQGYSMCTGDVFSVFARHEKNEPMRIKILYKTIKLIK
jgi:hypothetical protein